MNESPVQFNQWIRWGWKLKWMGAAAALFQRFDRVHPRCLEGPFCRQLRAEPWFRVAVLGCIGVLAITAAGLPRIWRVTATGFVPEIRVSGFDRLEAGLQARIAAISATRGDLQGSVIHWRSSVAANPADLGSVRRLIEAEAALPVRDPAAVARLGGEARWLLRLGCTNIADAERVVRVAEHFRADDLVLGVIRDSLATLSPRLRMARAKVLLRSGDFDGFSREGARVSPTDGIADATWPTYWLAWTAGIDSSERGRLALSELETVARGSEPGSREIALRLLLVVSIRRGDATGAGVALSRLRECRSDTPVDHLRFWRLLSRIGHDADARRLALAYADPPVGLAEMEQVGQMLTELGLWDEAVEFYGRCCNRLWARGRIWVAYGTVLVHLEHWGEVRDLAARMRSQPEEVATWVGYSRYLDGIACLGSGRTNDAVGEFRRLLEAPACNVQAALAAAADLVGRRFPDVAVGLLYRREQELAEFPPFWQVLVRAAVQRSDAELMLRAARREWALTPDSLEAMNDLAVALLLNEAEPERQLTLTRRILDADPTSVAARIHHGLALLGNRLPRAAKPLLLSVDPEGLDASQQNSLAFARTELYAQENQPNEALRELRSLKPGFLFPQQVARVEQLRMHLEATTAVQ
jgi:hypothetical protein